MRRSTNRFKSINYKYKGRLTRAALYICLIPYCVSVAVSESQGVAVDSDSPFCVQKLDVVSLSDEGNLAAVHILFSQASGLVIHSAAVHSDCFTFLYSYISEHCSDMSSRNKIVANGIRGSRS